MPPRGLSPSGLVLVDKREGPSSFAIVRELRTQTGARAGHAGTLDPLATGLLLVLLGAATRLAQYLIGLSKRYVTEIDLTTVTTTGDVQGDVVDTHEPPSPHELQNLLVLLHGEVELRIPAASAVKIAGERAYRLARRGVQVEMPMRTSVVHDVELLRYDGRVVALDLHVSSGTYVRAIAAALGGHCRTLRRTEVGPFSVEEADPERVLSPIDALPFLPVVELDETETAGVRAGRSLARPCQPGLARLVAQGDLVAVGRSDGERIRPETVLPR